MGSTPKRDGGDEIAREATRLAALQRLSELPSHALVQHSTYIAVIAPTRAKAEEAADRITTTARESGLQLTECVTDARSTLGTLFPWWKRRGGRIRRLLAGPVHPEHEDSTFHARALYPAQAGSPFPSQGVAIGLDVVSREIACYDPWEWCSQGIITSPLMFIVGQDKTGKSAFAKAMLSRQGGVFGRQVYVLDSKGEYTPLAATLGLPSFRLGPGGNAHLNPLEPVPGEGSRDLAARRAKVADALATVILQRRLDPHEEAALFEATACLGADATLGNLVDVLLSPPDDLVAALATSTQRLADDVRGVALALRNLSSGRLAGMLDGPDTVRLNEAPGLHFDLSLCSDEKSILAPVMTAALSWLTPRLAQPGKKFLLFDETWAVLQDHPDLATWLGDTVELTRTLDVSAIFIAHRVSDIVAIRETASKANNWAKRLLAGTQLWIAFSQPPGELDALAAAIDIEVDELKMVSGLPRGRCLVVAGEKRALWDVVLSEREMKITNTDAVV